jgi:hypothetical protein
VRPLEARRGDTFSHGGVLALPTSTYTATATLVEACTGAALTPPSVTVQAHVVPDGAPPMPTIPSNQTWYDVVLFAAASDTEGWPQHSIGKTPIDSIMVITFQDAAATPNKFSASPLVLRSML